MTTDKMRERERDREEGRDGGKMGRRGGGRERKEGFKNTIFLAGSRICKESVSINQ